MAKSKRPDPRAASIVDRKIGEKIRASRLAMAMSQESLADAIGVTFQQIQKYEKGFNRVSARTLMDIARVLNVPLERLLPVDKENPEPGIPAHDQMESELNAVVAGLNSEGRALLLRLATALKADPALRRKRQG